MTAESVSTTEKSVHEDSEVSARRLGSWFRRLTTHGAKTHDLVRDDSQLAPDDSRVPRYKP
jgi:hypothetical protein